MLPDIDMIEVPDSEPDMIRFRGEGPLEPIGQARLLIRIEPASGAWYLASLIRPMSDGDWHVEWTGPCPNPWQQARQLEASIAWRPPGVLQHPSPHRDRVVARSLQAAAGKPITSIRTEYLL
jgi:hypothetical protein